MELRTFKVGEGPFELEVVVVDTGRGVTVTVGSTAPGTAHVGATAQAIPRPEPGRTATVSILAVPCHRDEVPAHDIAAAVATRLGVPVVASCGIHVDNATRDDIKRLVDLAHEAADRIVDLVERGRRARWDEPAQVLAVSRAGDPIGPVDRAEAHAGAGILHQAFSIFLVEGTGADAHLLLCRRSPHKQLWGGVLADACAGHPYVGESLEEGAARRLTEELGVTTPLSQLGHIVYREDHGDGRCECEWCAVFAGRLDCQGEHGAALRLNEEEVSELRRIPLTELDAYCAGTPEPLAPWVRGALEDADIRGALEAFAAGNASA